VYSVLSVLHSLKELIRPRNTFALNGRVGVLKISKKLRRESKSLWKIVHPGKNVSLSNNTAEPLAPLFYFSTSCARLNSGRVWIKGCHLHFALSLLSQPVRFKNGRFSDRRLGTFLATDIVKTAQTYKKSNTIPISRISLSIIGRLLPNPTS